MELLRGDRDALCVAHRGGAALAPENSLDAIRAAAACGADAVELDVLPRPDGTLVLAHGPAIPDDAPSLDAGLALVAGLGVAVQLDVKVTGVAGGAAAALRRHGLLERSFVSSWSPAVLRGFADAVPAVPRSLTYPEDRRGLSARRLLRPGVRAVLAGLRAALPARLPRLLGSVGARAATLNAAVVSPRAVAVCHAAGVAVYVWTVNEAALARTLVESGIDGIITDDPRILRPGRPNT